MRALLMLGVCACGFAPSPVSGTGDASGDGVFLDAHTIDASDAMAGNARRKSITFTTISGMHTDFPAWIDVTDAQIAARAQSNGGDIYFTAADGTTRLDHQLMGWSANRLTAWVRVPQLKSASVIYVNYGDLGAAPGQNPVGTFKANFAAVWHLDDALSAATIADATGTHAGTPAFTTTSKASTAQLGSGLTFAASGDEITFTNPLSNNAPHTMSVWVDQPAVTHVSAIVVVGTGTQNHARWFYSHFLAATIAVGFYSNDWVANNSIDNASWTLLHWVFEGSNGVNRLYKNGVEIATSPQTLNGIATMGTTGIIGHAPEPAYGTNTGLEGSIDELRIATVTRSAAWIATEYANQHTPSAFYTLGAEQLVP